MIFFVFIFIFSCECYIGIEFLRVNGTKEEKVILQQFLQNDVFGETNHSIGNTDVEFHNCYVFLDSISADIYTELVESVVVISGSLEEIKDFLVPLFNQLSYNCFSPLAQNLPKIVNTADRIVRNVTVIMNEMSEVVTTLEKKVKEEIEKAHFVLYNEENGTIYLWNDFVVNSFPKCTNNIMSRYIEFVDLFDQSMNPTLILYCGFIGAFGIWVLLYLVRFYPSSEDMNLSNRSFETSKWEILLKSYALPAIPLFIGTGMLEVVLGVCVMLDPQGISKYFLKNILVVLFFLVGVFLFFQFSMICIYLLFVSVKKILEWRKERLLSYQSLNSPSRWMDNYGIQNMKGY